jgi:hypothetical protein
MKRLTQKAREIKSLIRFVEQEISTNKHEKLRTDILSLLYSELERCWE